MNDLAICKRIAEIECHWWVTDRGLYLYIMKEYAESKDHPLPTYYNPLTDDALCFQLMVKYKISIDHEDSMCGVMVQKSNNHWEYLGNICYDDDTSINKAILLAIIAAHKD